MNALTPLLVALGGALGATLRWATAEGVARLAGRSAVPWATLAVNVVGCLLIGYVAARGTDAGWLTRHRPLVVAGFCGSLTTFSTFGLETVELLPRRPLVAVGLVGLHLIFGLGAVALGMWLSR